MCCAVLLFTGVTTQVMTGSWATRDIGPACWNRRPPRERSDKEVQNAECVYEWMAVSAWRCVRVWVWVRRHVSVKVRVSVCKCSSTCEGEYLSVCMSYWSRSLCVMAWHPHLCICASPVSLDGLWTKVTLQVCFFLVGQQSLKMTPNKPASWYSHCCV